MLQGEYILEGKIFFQGMRSGVGPYGVGGGGGGKENNPFQKKEANT